MASLPTARPPDAGAVPRSMTLPPQVGSGRTHETFDMLVAFSETTTTDKQLAVTFTTEGYIAMHGPALLARAEGHELTHCKLVPNPAGDALFNPLRVRDAAGAAVDVIIHEPTGTTPADTLAATPAAATTTDKTRTTQNVLCARTGVPAALDTLTPPQLLSGGQWGATTCMISQSVFDDAPDEPVLEIMQVFDSQSVFDDTADEPVLEIMRVFDLQSVFDDTPDNPVLEIMQVFDSQSVFNDTPNEPVLEIMQVFGSQSKSARAPLAPTADAHLLKSTLAAIDPVALTADKHVLESARAPLAPIADKRLLLCALCDLFFGRYHSLK